MTSISKQFADSKIIGENDFKASSVEIYDADTRANIDLQVSTAKKYRRNLPTVLDNILFFATQSPEIAQDCFYSIVKDGKIIRGATVRFAEIVASCYGNLRASSKVISNDNKTLTAQGIAWDLENNVAYSIEVKNSITYSDGNPYPEDLQNITANKACSIAIRNAIFKCIPVAFTNKLQNDIKSYAMGVDKEFISTRNSTIDYFTTQGVSMNDILKLFSVNSVDELTRENVFDLKGLQNAIKYGETTIQSIFRINPKQNVLGKASKKLWIPVDDVDELNRIAEEHIMSDDIESLKRKQKNEIKGLAEEHIKSEDIDLFTNKKQKK